METIKSNKLTIGPTLAFAGFSLGLALRDISAEIFLNEIPMALAFVVCTTIVVMATFQILFTTGFGDLWNKLTKPGTIKKAVSLGVMSGAIYLGIFYLIKHMGAGLFGMIDYGLIPIATAAVGAIFFKEKLGTKFWLACLSYLIGISLLMSEYEFFGFSLIAIAIFCPTASAASDGLTKWLLDPNCGGLTRAQLLFVRFLPASIALLTLNLVSSGTVTVNNPLRAITIAVLLGWGPLMLLCTGLGREGLKKLASWSFIIPGICFFGTLHLHMDTHAKPLPILGALLALSGILIAETKLLDRFLPAKKLANEKSTKAA